MDLQAEIYRTWEGEYIPSLMIIVDPTKEEAKVVELREEIVILKMIVLLSQKIERIQLVPFDMKNSRFIVDATKITQAPNLKKI